MVFAGKPTCSVLGFILIAARRQLAKLTLTARTKESNGTEKTQKNGDPQVD